MAIKTNANSVKETLMERLKDDSKILKDLSIFFSFCATALSGEPISLIAGLALILKTASVSISAGCNIIKKILDFTKKEQKQFSKYDQFRSLFYISCLNCYLESLSEAIKKIQKIKTPNSKKKEVDEEKRQNLLEELNNHIKEFEEAEVSYLFCIEPLESEVPLFASLDKWALTTLAYYGYHNYEIQEIIKEASLEARRRFKSYLSENRPESIWMSNYLAITSRERISSIVIDNLQSIQNILENWTDNITVLKKRREESWNSYREDLQNLPDQKESMYNEQFGVRKVFLQPEVKYHIVGACGDAGKPNSIPDLGHLFGALISTRASGEDLIILSGGPGSGKSTLCRILSSELSKDPKIFPIFLRLRRLKEGSDIALFVEESMQKVGLINHFTDLRNFTNLVLILDGFDELVMASRSRLRHFFNMLREEHNVGPLRNAKIIISGRDTLFPQGEGLPTGSHVISLQPFNKERVKAWGKKWRKLHESSPGNSFYPETLIEEGNGKYSPLHHLVTWPLTLHLVARVHTAGRLNIGKKESQEIEKAYLYRSILSETATRQLDQAKGKGRLKPKEMREFLRELAWEMYTLSTDSMDPTDVAPLLTKYYPEASEADMSDIADVAVVNSPELTKGEETGFEFVHKSFSEYLVAEKMAHCIERVTFKAPEFGSDELTWRMTSQEAASELAPVIGLRLITEEVQEMIEPMLGCLIPFLKGDRVDQIVSGESRYDGLIKIIERFEELYKELIQGKSLDIINKNTQEKLLIKSPLEAFANQCAGLMILGTAAARQITKYKKLNESKVRLFNLEPSENIFWRCLCILYAGGINMDYSLSRRLFDGTTVLSTEESDGINDLSIPIKLASLGFINGYKQCLSSSSGELYTLIKRYDFLINILIILLPSLSHGKVSSRLMDKFHLRNRISDTFSRRHIRPDVFFGRSHDFQDTFEILIESGLVDDKFVRLPSDNMQRFEDLLHYLSRDLVKLEEKPEVIFQTIDRILRDMYKNAHNAEKDLIRFIAELIEPYYNYKKNKNKVDSGTFSRLFGKKI